MCTSVNEELLLVYKAQDWKQNRSWTCSCG